MRFTAELLDSDGLINDYVEFGFEDIGNVIPSDDVMHLFGYFHVPVVLSSVKPVQDVPAVGIDFDFVTIPSGDFGMGSTDADDMAWDDEKPQFFVHLDEYRISRVPVTNRQYKVFVEATNHPAPSHWPDGEIPVDEADHPVVNVSWHDVVAFCTWARVRLPSEAEWEKAARGTDARIYPWGNATPDETRCNFSNNVGGTLPVGDYPLGASPYGVLDMAGNVWEWTSTQFKGYPYKSDDGREDVQASGARMLRGGSWISYDRFVRCAYRNMYYPVDRHGGVGFRVVSPGS